MERKIAVIGVGNMAKAILAGIRASDLEVSSFYIYDINTAQYNNLTEKDIHPVKTIGEAISNADCVLLSVKPQNFPEVLAEIKNIPCSAQKLYITIAAGISVEYISNILNTNNIVRVLPNLPMIISKGVSAICLNENVSKEDFDFVVKIFESSGSVLKINENDMNKTIGVTSSSPAYVFKFIDAICEGAIAQGISEDGLTDVVCDVLIGAAELIKKGYGSPKEMITAVASKGGTTEKALEVLNKNNFDNIVSDAMLACTNRADELGKIK